MKVHSCIEASIEDYSNIAIDIQQFHCCSPVSIHTIEEYCNANIYDKGAGSYSINDGVLDAFLNIESKNDALVTLEWVCGVGFSERYLCGCDSELITIDGNYLVVKYKPES